MAEELMTEQEIHLFGLQVLIQFLEGKGYEIEFAQPDKASLPHVVAGCGDQITFIIAATDVYPNKGKVSDADKAAVLEHAKQFNANCACAYLGIANAVGVENKDKALMGKAYRNARFVTDFGGLEFICFEN